MANLPLSLTCADYARVMPLATGDVKPDGIDLTMILGSGGILAEARRDAASCGERSDSARRRIVDGRTFAPD